MSEEVREHSPIPEEKTSEPIEHTESQNQEESKSTPPPLPPKDKLYISAATELGNQAITFSVTDNVSRISVVRQVEFYSSPQLNEVSDIFVNNSIGSDTIKSRIDQIKQDDNLSDELKYWIRYVEDYSNEFLRKENGIKELEENILKGIPDSIRALVYLKTLQVRFKLNPKEGFASLLTRAKHSNSNKDQFLEKLSLDNNSKEVLMVLNYYVNDLTNNNNSTALDSIPSEELKNENQVDSSAGSNKLPFNKSLIHIAKYLSSVSAYSQEDVLYILLKFNKLFLNLIKDEFFYKVNRTLEEELPEEFKHIAVQGINLNIFYKSLVSNFFEDIWSQEECVKILDFVVFEGFDFILRLIVWAFSENKQKVGQLEGDDLLRFIHSREFLSDLALDFPGILSQEPQIIKYENEFHLIHANSLNNNTNELTNLKEINEELLIKVNELKNGIDNLQTTYNEILGQSEQYTTELQKAKEENEDLSNVKEELQLKYENLTMKENLKNTIKANKDFSQRNKELEEQIEEVRSSIEKKRGKLDKLAPKKLKLPTPPPTVDESKEAGSLEETTGKNVEPEPQSENVEDKVNDNSTST